MVLCWVGGVNVIIISMAVAIVLFSIVHVIFRGVVQVGVVRLGQRICFFQNSFSAKRSVQVNHHDHLEHLDQHEADVHADDSHGILLQPITELLFAALMVRGVSSSKQRSAEVQQLGAPGRVQAGTIRAEAGTGKNVWVGQVQRLNIRVLQPIVSTRPATALPIVLHVVHQSVLTASSILKDDPVH